MHIYKYIIFGKYLLINLEQSFILIPVIYVNSFIFVGIMDVDLPQNVNKMNETKNINCKLGVLSRPDGSAFLSQGETAVLAGVYGPIETKQAKFLIDKANVETYFRPKAGLPSVVDKLNEHIIKNICETALVTTLYLRSAVVIVVQEMQNCGGLISCAVNACCCALLNSGIDLKCLVAGVSCILSDDNKLLIEPSTLEYAHAKAAFEFVFDNVNYDLVASHTSGSFSFDIYEKALVKCKKASENVFEFYKRLMSEKF